MAHILIVDDDDLFREMLVEMVGRDGHRVEAVADGRQALQAIERHRPDLVITDILMPEKDGIELILELSHRDAALPIVAISGGRRAISREFNLESAKLLGVRATLPKPFAREDLRRVIAEALSGRGA